jgi:hypothetical protein
MFHFRPSPSSLERRLSAIEDRIDHAGQRAGRQVSSTGDQLGDIISATVSELVRRVRSGRRVAGDEALRFGSDAAAYGTKVGSDLLDRVAREVTHRPLVVLGAAIGIGLLIGVKRRRRH